MIGNSDNSPTDNNGLLELGLMVNYESGNNGELMV